MWRFFTDLIHENAMDKEPFVTWDVLNDDQPPYELLKLLQKSQFKTELVRTFAQRQHDLNFLVNELDKLLEPSAQFTQLAIANIEKKRPLTPEVVEAWKSLVARAIGEWAKQRTLADVLNPSPPRTKTAGYVPQTEKKRKRDREGVTLPDLIAAGILTPPLNLFRTYNGRLLEATLLPDGKVKFQGVIYASCSQAGGVARGQVTGRPMNTNGWDFWQYRDASGKRHCLADARRRYGNAGAGEEMPTGRVTAAQKRVLTYLATLPKDKTASHHQLVCVARNHPFGTSATIAKIGGGCIGNIREDNSAHPHSLIARGWVEAVEIQEDGRTSTRLRLTPSGVQAAKEHAVALKHDYPSE